VLLDVKYVNPFLKVTIQIIDQITGIKLQKGKIYAKSHQMPMNDIAIIVGVTGGLSGQMVLGMDIETAKAISGKMQGKEIKFFDELSKSAISELANIIMGNVATVFSKQNISLNITPPTLFVGKNMSCYSSKSTIISIPFELNIYGKLEVDIVMNEAV
jgi:chemotaxis protein CheX